MAEVLEELAASPEVMWGTSNREPYTPGVIILMFISHSTIQLTIFFIP
jgi:hypothetical protein